MKKLSARQLTLMAFCLLLGLCAKRIISPVTNVLTDFFRIPGGSAAVGFSLAFLLIGREAAPVFGSATLMGFLQSLLALALGLSDETQSSAGGIRIDTMFIDEGFGSLSPDVLELALRTLEKLAAKGTLIGLISHVESMKDRYRRIDVEKTGGGSTIVVR